jgi:hypothetical protein
MLLPPEGKTVTIPDKIPLPGLCPYTGQESGDFLVTKRFLEHLEFFGPTSKFYDALLVSETIEKPTVVFEGLKRSGLAKGLCFVSSPSNRWLDGETKSPPPSGKVFVVYVRPTQGGGLLVFDWDWRIADPSCHGYPNQWQLSYSRKLWPQTN